MARQDYVQEASGCHSLVLGGAPMGPPPCAPVYTPAAASGGERWWGGLSPCTHSARDITETENRKNAKRATVKALRENLLVASVSGLRMPGRLIQKGRGEQR